MVPFAPRTALLSRYPLCWTALLAVLLGVQVTLHGVMDGVADAPDALRVPGTPPSAETALLMALGDRQLAFRLQALRLQNAGDTGGQFTPLSQYNYAQVGHWLALLDRLDAASSVGPVMAAYYYALTPNRDDLRPLIAYLEAHAAHDPAQKWWWHAQAAYLAQYRLGDTQLALAIAYRLRDAPGRRPVWTRQLPAFIHEQRGEREQARAIMQSLLAEPAQLSAEDKRFIAYFLQQRVGVAKMP